jgi:uncharacterized protein (DUF488 family)
MDAEVRDCKGDRVVHTIGHSTRDIVTFLEMLDEHGIALVVDIRRWPSSRRFPHFNKDSLGRSLEEHGIDYIWIESLGGYRKPAPDSPNTGWKVGAFRAYADYMLTDEFRRVFEGLERTAQTSRIALMCAEALPWRCHRQILSDAFVVRSWTVRHIIDGRCDLHQLPNFAEVENGRLYYRQTRPLF